MEKKLNGKFLKRVAFTFKTVCVILLGIVKPIRALIEPDDTTYRTKFRGVISDNGHLESWKDLRDDFRSVLKEM